MLSENRTLERFIVADLLFDGSLIDSFRDEDSCSIISELAFCWIERYTFVVLSLGSGQVVSKPVSWFVMDSTEGGRLLRLVCC